MLPDGRSLVEEWKELPFSLLGVNTDESLEAARRWSHDAGVTWPNLWDGRMGSEGSINVQWGIAGAPTFFLIDPEGVIRWQGRELPKEAAAELLEELSAKAVDPEAAAELPAADAPFSGSGDSWESDFLDDEDGANAEKVRVAARLERDPEAPEERVVLTVTIDVAEGYHIYGSRDAGGQATRLTVTSPSGLESLEEAVIPEGELHIAQGVASYWIGGTTVLRQTFRRTESTDAELGPVTGRVSYMACTELFCEPPATLTFRASLGDS